MKRKHGTSQYRLNHAKSQAQAMLENIQRIEMMWQMSEQGVVDEEIADRYIRSMIDETTSSWKYLEGYISYREDMTK
ncbi:hypothetical protein [Shouchella clausii]|uniref:hypothetical protein n=1 Tax=Shouchella clausii TaxID=79880 RepID=UPI001C7377F0|nr:hypothetical protein [Shouchella clausii]MBX0320112.1 hypothetical protein [Shouchella clausii]